MIKLYKEAFFIYIFITHILNISYVESDNFNYINLPKSHLPFYFNYFKHVAKECLNDEECEYHDLLNDKNYNKELCWGYEDDCKKENFYSYPTCSGDHLGWVKSKEAQLDTYYTQADFGYVKQQINEMTVMCNPLFIHDSSLECTKYLRFCRGRNIMINFTDLLNNDEPSRYRMDVLKPGQIGGFCNLNKTLLLQEATHISPLQSWAPELRYFEELDKRPITDICDIVIEKPTYIMKIDATVNMYHHFCDFFNLYASLHVNKTHKSAFSQDVNILIWETYRYDSPFAETFKAFTINPIWNLKTFQGKIVCFKNLVLPLLPRMIFGLYYNTPIIYGCENSGLFHAFSEHIMHRLNIPLYQRIDKKLRLTFLSRQTKYRKILNENDLIAEISDDTRIVVQRVEYNLQIPFKKQLEITRNTDIFIGIHGAGLTHLLFLPNWATIIELYNCEDPACYRDLARLRGVNYLTWENKKKLFQEDEGHHPEGGAHAKFTNYAFNRKEFKRLVNKAIENTLNHPEFINFTESITLNNQHTEL